MLQRRSSSVVCNKHQAKAFVSLPSPLVHRAAFTGDLNTNTASAASERGTQPRRLQRGVTHPQRRSHMPTWPRSAHPLTHLPGNQCFINSRGLNGFKIILFVSRQMPSLVKERSVPVDGTKVCLVSGHERLAWSGVEGGGWG